jgi:hypothetical protein
LHFLKSVPFPLQQELEERAIRALSQIEKGEELANKELREMKENTFSTFTSGGA